MSERPQTPHAQAMFDVIERYQKSGLTQKAFCQSEALALSTFQYWLARYRRRHHAEQQQSSRPLLVELKAEAPIPSGNDGVVVSYPNGVEVRLAATVELAVLKALITL